MKRMLLALVFAVAGLGTLRAAPPAWQIITVVFFTNQTCVVTQEVLQGRSELETQLRRFERYIAPDMGSGPDGTEEAPEIPPPVVPPPTTPTTTVTNDFETRVRRMMAIQNRYQQGITSKVERVEVTTNQVRMVSTMTFTSLVELASQPLHEWTPYPLELVEARFETTNGLFRTTFTPSPRAGSVLRRLSRNSGSQFNFEWRLAFPGPLRESSFPQTNANQAWVRIETGNAAAVTNLLPLLQKPLVFAADAAGMAIPSPIQSNRPARRSGQSSGEPEIPITDAGPGFIAEAESLAINTLYQFPGAATNRPAARAALGTDGEPDEDSEMDPEMMMMAMQGQSPEELLVQVRLFAPRERTIRKLTDLKLLRAVDDQGRAVPEAAMPKLEGVEAGMQSFMSYPRSASVSFQLRLALPEPDAQSIETLEAEAIVTTLGDWQSLVLTNLQADAKKEIPLDNLIPGARLVVTKIETRNNTKVDLRLSGPRDIGLLDLKLRQGRRPVRNANANDTSPPATGTNATRQVSIQAYDYTGRPATPQPYSLEVRFPRDTKRERVRITLTALDLL